MYPFLSLPASTSMTPTQLDVIPGDVVNPSDADGALALTEDFSSDVVVTDTPDVPAS